MLRPLLFLGLSLGVLTSLGAQRAAAPEVSPPRKELRDMLYKLRGQLDVDQRRAFIATLARHGQPVLSEILMLSVDRDAGLRDQALEILERASFDIRKAHRHLLGRLDREQGRLRVRVAWALLGCEQDQARVIEVIQELGRHRDRRRLLDRLGDSDTAAALGVLRQAFSDPSLKLRALDHAFARGIGALPVLGNLIEVLCAEAETAPTYRHGRTKGAHFLNPPARRSTPENCIVGVGAAAVPALLRAFAGAPPRSRVAILRCLARLPVAEAGVDRVCRQALGSGQAILAGPGRALLQRIVAAAPLNRALDLGAKVWQRFPDLQPKIAETLARERAGDELLARFDRVIPAQQVLILHALARQPEASRRSAQRLARILQVAVSQPAVQVRIAATLLATAHGLAGTEGLLIGLLSAAERPCRLAACAALASLRQPSAASTAPLRALLVGPDRDLRVSALAAVSAHGPVHLPLAAEIEPLRRSRDPVLRRAAQTAWVHIHTDRRRSLTSLAAAARGDADARHAILHLLAHRPERASVLLTAQAPDELRLVLDALSGVRAVPALREVLCALLRHADPAVQLGATRCLLRHPTTAELPPGLCLNLRSASSRLREASAELLARHEARHIVAQLEPLVTLLRDRHVYVQIAALRALRSVGADARPGLAGILASLEGRSFLVMRLKADLIEAIIRADRSLQQEALPALQKALTTAPGPAKPKLSRLLLHIERGLLK